MQSAWDQKMRISKSKSIFVSVLCLSTLLTQTPHGSQFVSASAAPALTRITIHMPECKNCTIALDRSTSSGESWQKEKKYKLKNGWVKFSIPKSETRGITFYPRTAAADWRSLGNTASVVAVQYSGIKPGRKISIAQAKRMKTGSPCWAGTTKSRYLITIKTYRWNVKPTELDTGKNVSFWASPQLDSVPLVYENGGVTWVLSGGIGTQQVLTCQS